MKKTIAMGLSAALLLALAGPASAQVKPEDQIKIRKAGYTFMAWNMGRIKANLEGAYNKDEVIQAANAIAAIAASGMGALYGPGTDRDVGEQKTRAKPELWKELPKVGEIGGRLRAESARLAEAAASGDAARVKAQFGEVGKTCKACHDSYRKE